MIPQEFSGTLGSSESEASYFNCLAAVELKSSAALLPLCTFRFGFFNVLFNSQLHDSLDEIQRDRLRQRKLKVAFRSRVSSQRLFKYGVPGDGWVHADVFFPCRKVEQNTVLSKGRHLVADDFLGTRGGAADGRANVGQNYLNFRRELLDVLINTGW